MDQKSKILDEIQRIKFITFECQFCSKKFNKEYNLKRHQVTSCRELRSDDDPQIQKILKRIEQLTDKEKLVISEVLNKQTLKQLNTRINQGEESVATFNHQGDGSTINQVNDQSQNSHNNNNINLNVNVVNFGDENEEMLEDEDFADQIFNYLYENLKHSDFMFDNGWLIEPVVISRALTMVHKHVHCNKDYPENHNMYVGNAKFPTPFKIFQNDEWMPADLNTLYQSVERSEKRLIDLIDKLIEFNPEHDKKLQTLKESCLNAFIRTNYEKGQRLKAKDLYLGVYCNKEMIKQTKQLHKKQKKSQAQLVQPTEKLKQLL